ncbi:hypothetical protein [Streptomyces sp. NPDC007905]
MDLVGALQESVDKARATRGGTGTADVREALAEPAKKFRTTAR